VDGANNVYAAGGFVGTVDFDPGGGIDLHTSNGYTDAFLKFMFLSHVIYLPLIRK
jgi:hypothetical protein